MINRIKNLFKKNRISLVKKDTDEYKDIMEKLENSPKAEQLLEQIKEHVALQNQKMDMLTSAVKDIQEATLMLQQSHEDLIQAMYEPMTQEYDDPDFANGFYSFGDNDDNGTDGSDLN